MKEIPSRNRPKDPSAGKWEQPALFEVGNRGGYTIKANLPGSQDSVDMLVDQGVATYGDAWEIVESRLKSAPLVQEKDVGRAAVKKSVVSGHTGLGRRGGRGYPQSHDFRDDSPRLDPNDQLSEEQKAKNERNIEAIRRRARIVAMANADPGDWPKMMAEHRTYDESRGLQYNPVTYAEIKEYLDKKSGSGS